MFASNAMTMTAAAHRTLISEEYRKQQQELHRNPDYGVASVKYARLVADVAVAQGATELLDYGAGKGRLGHALKPLLPGPLTIHHYDPAIPEWAGEPRPCRLVACIDVLEHIEPEYVYNVVDDLKRVVAGHGVFTVATGPAEKVLDDGRNAHLVQKPASWWLPLFMERFELVAFNRVDDGFWIVVEALKTRP